MLPLIKSLRLVALRDAFAHLNGALEPASDAYKLRNPLLLKAFSPKHERNEKGLRRFQTISAGMDNGIIDVTIKCSGKSFFKIGPNSTLTDLVCLYGNKAAAARIVKNFLQVALQDDTVSESTPLSWFLEGEQLPPSARAAHYAPQHSDGDTV